MNERRGAGPWALLTVVLASSLPVSAQTPPQPGPRIFTCIDATGKKLTSDRTIPECSTREQRVLNSDGSVKGVVPPTMTADERSDAEQRDRDASAERVARQDATRRDRNLVARFPDEAAHRKAREGALDDVRNAVRISEARVKLLTVERKPLLDESEFYVGKPLPAKLKTALDANDASLAAQRSLIQNQEVEVSRINGLYDIELVRLKRLWSGVPAGSLGLLATPKAAPEPAAAARSK